MKSQQDIAADIIEHLALKEKASLRREKVENALVFDDKESY